MYRLTFHRLTWIERVHAAREETARRFGNINCLGTPGAIPGFDNFVAQKREEKQYEDFDQRVERAFQKAWGTHKQEVWNAHKRQVRDGTLPKGTSLNQIRDLEGKLEERKEWLRNVWAQVDSDYRSGDTERVTRAMSDIEKANAGKGNGYMEWAYQTKYDMRFMGNKEKDELVRKLNSTEFPDISEEETTRFINRKMNMNELEKSVTRVFGKPDDATGSFCSRKKMMNTRRKWTARLTCMKH